MLIDRLDPALFIPLRHPPANRSGVLCVVSRRRRPEELVERLRARSFISSARGDYLRVAAHFFVTDEEIERLAEAMNELG
jgi:selenocysteine lyase/cysteine desulfurase